MSHPSTAAAPPSDDRVGNVLIRVLSFNQRLDLRNVFEKYSTKLPRGMTLSSPDGKTHKTLMAFLFATLRHRGYKPLNEGFKQTDWIGNGDAIHIILYEDGGLIFDLSNKDWDDGALTWFYQELVQEPNDIAEGNRRYSNQLRQMARETNRLKNMNDEWKRKYKAIDPDDIQRELEEVRRKRAALDASEVVASMESDLEDEYGDW